MRARWLLGGSLLVVSAAFGACGSESADGEDGESGCSSHDDCSEGAPYCGDDGACVEPPAGSELGWSDEAVEISVILADAAFKRPTDLAFNPSVPGELWVINRTDDSVVIIQDPGAETMTFQSLRDPAASHFMHLPPAIAMGSVDPEWGQTFGICGDGNNGGNNFMGPALFATDLDVFAKQTDFGLGSHLDMLHSTSFCRGIEFDEGNRFFAFNSQEGSIDEYDFADDHDPGNDDHSDGSIFRLAAGQFTGVDGVPSHLALHRATRELFVADTGTGRVMGVMVDSGTPGGDFGNNEPIVVRQRIDGVTVREVVPAGVLSQPSGLEVKGDTIFVSDHATGKLHAFDLAGEELASLDTTLGASALAGFTFGPDGLIYLVDMANNRVLRIDPRP